MSSATTVTSYRPVEGRAKRVEEQSAVQMRVGEKLAVIIPALEEAENLGGLLCRVRDALKHVEIPWEVMVVDDDSRDGTEEIVSTIAREDPRVRLLERRGAKGLSGAIVHGWRHTDATILGVMDADGQHPAEVLPALLASIRAGQDLAIGSRYAIGGRSGWNPIRWLISMAAISVARPLQPVWLRVRDPLSGFFMVRRHCVENVVFQTTGFKLLLEILVRGRIDSVQEIPFVFGRRRAGRSKVSLKVGCDYLKLIARLYRVRMRVARVPQTSSGD